MRVTGRRVVPTARRSTAAHSVLSRGAHTVPPMPVVTGKEVRAARFPTRVVQSLGAGSASVDHEGHGERLTRQRSRLTALGSCGESPNGAAVRCCGRYGSCDTVTRGCTQWSTRGRRALLNDFARQGNPRSLSHNESAWKCQAGDRRLWRLRSVVDGFRHTNHPLTRCPWSSRRLVTPSSRRRWATCTCRTRT